MAESLAAASDASTLTGESAGDEIDVPGICSDVSNVSVNRDSWEPSLEQAGSELVDLAEPAMLEPGEVESVCEESAAIE